MELHDAQGVPLSAASEIAYLHGGYGHMLDANHPLAGMALRFSLVILTVREASEEELRRGVSLP